MSEMTKLVKVHLLLLSNVQYMLIIMTGLFSCLCSTLLAEASSVSNLKCYGPNSPEAGFVMSWSRPEGSTTRFTVNISKDNTLINSSNSEVQCNPTCMYNVFNLSHYTNYTVAVQTLACGPPSEIQDCTNLTGITSMGILRQINVD